MVVRRSSVFPARREDVFALLQRLETLQFVAAPMATFEPVGGAVGNSWEVGDTSAYRFRLFGLVPFGTHVIHIERFDHDVIQSREHNDYVSVWDHKINLADLGDATAYTDEVRIDAGWRTPFIWLWAQAFYAHRQRKWMRLLESHGR